MSTQRGGTKRGGPRPGANVGLSIGSVLGILLGWSIGGTIGGPVGSTSGYIGAFLGALVGIGAGMFLGYWVGASIASVTKRSKPRQRRQASHTTLAAINHGDKLVPKRRTLLDRGCAVTGILFGLLILFSIVLLPAIVLAIVGIALAVVPTQSVPLPGRVCGFFMAAICLFYLGAIGYINLKRPRPAGKEPVLLASNTSQGPGTLIVTPTYVSIQRPPPIGSSFPMPLIVPRAEIVDVTREAPSSVAVAIFSFFGVMTSLTIHTRDGRMYGIDGVPIWKTRKLMRILTISPAKTSP